MVLITFLNNLEDIKNRFREIFDNDTVFNLMTIKNSISNNFRYDVPTNPKNIIYASPEIIDFSNNKISKQCGLGQIKSGDWDLNRTIWREHTTYIGLNQRFKKGYDWENTVYIKRAKKKLDETGSVAGYDSIDAFINNRCNYIDQIHSDIKRNGWKLKREQTVGDKYRGKAKHRSPGYKQKLEPLVSIDRYGRFHINDGRHRCAIAELIGIEKIPFNVLIRHKEWQNLRESVYSHKQNVAKNHILNNHPDIQTA